MNHWIIFHRRTWSGSGFARFMWETTRKSSPLHPPVLGLAEEAEASPKTCFFTWNGMNGGSESCQVSHRRSEMNWGYITVHIICNLPDETDHTFWWLLILNFGPSTCTSVRWTYILSSRQLRGRFLFSENVAGSLSDLRFPPIPSQC